MPDASSFRCRGVAGGQIGVDVGCRVRHRAALCRQHAAHGTVSALRARVRILRAHGHLFALGGFYGALAPGLLSQRLHQHDPAAVGAVVALFFGTGALVAAVTGRLRNRAAMLLATLLLLAGLALLLIAEQQRSMSWLLMATAVSGAAMALGYRCSLSMVNRMAPRPSVPKWSRPICWSATARIRYRSSVSGFSPGE